MPTSRAVQASWIYNPGPLNPPAPAGNCRTAAVAQMDHLIFGHRRSRRRHDAVITDCLPRRMGVCSIHDVSGYDINTGRLGSVTILVLQLLRVCSANAFPPRLTMISAGRRYRCRQLTARVPSVSDKFRSFGAPGLTRNDAAVSDAALSRGG